VGNVRTITATIIVIVGLLATACVPRAPQLPAGGSTGHAPYGGSPITGPENVTFLYHSVAETEAAGQLDALGHPRDIVFLTPNRATFPGDPAEVALAHGRGAKAIKYLELTLFPDTGDWLGTTQTQRAAWMLCKSGTTPLSDAGDGDGSDHGSVPWSYSDANELGFVNAVLGWTSQLRTMGYDGVFIDAGGRAVRGPYFDVASSCTDQPVKAGARSADAWFSMLMAVKAQGLLVSANMGAPTADPLTRPDPTNPSKVKTDVRAFAWILHENAGHPSENYAGDAPSVKVQLAPFERLAGQMSNDALFARGQVVEMAKSRLPLDDPNRARQDEYVWALAKLSGAPVVLNTGFDFCGVPWGTTDCNRTGLSPALTDVRLGSPIDAQPYKASCDSKGCLWVRRYRNGLVAASAYGTATRSTTVSLGTSGCRHVAAWKGGQQAGGKCVTSVSVQTGPNLRWAHVYLYS
jgi:hypothetical protein